MGKFEPLTVNLNSKATYVLKTCIQMWRHSQCFQRSKEAAINYSVHSKESSKNLTTKRCKGWRLKDAQCFLFVVIVGKLRFVVNLVGDPEKRLFYVRGRWNRNRISVRLGPAIFYARRVTFARSKGGEEGVIGKNRPNSGGVVVKVDRMNGNPARTAFAGRKRYLI